MNYKYLLLLSAIAFPVGAVEDVPPPPTIKQDAPPTPSIPPVEQPEEEQLESKITIIRHSGYTAEEYRVNGHLRFVKIIPDFGVPYYLVDRDGDGFLETSRYQLDDSMLASQWILFRW